LPGFSQFFVKYTRGLNPGIQNVAMSVVSLIRITSGFERSEGKRLILIAHFIFTLFFF